MERASKAVQITLAVVLLVLAGFGLFRLVGEALADEPWEPTEEIPVPSWVDWDAQPDVTVDGLGRAYAVWQGYSFTSWTLFLSVRSAHGSWSVGQDLFTDHYYLTNEMKPVIAVDPTGDLHLLWEEEYSEDSSEGIKYCFRPPGGQCEPVVKVNDSPGWAGDPAVAMDSSGNVYAIWSDRRNGDSDIYFSVLPPKGLWSANNRVNDDTGTSVQSSPAIAVDPAGNAYAVWADERDDVSDIFFSYRPAGGNWGTNVKVNDDSGSAWQSEPDIAVDASGNAYAVWTDARHLDQYDTYVYFSYRPAGGTWSPNVQVGRGGVADQYTPKIAVDPMGYSHAIWTEERSIPPDIYSSVRSPGGEWGINVKVNDDMYYDNNTFPAIVVDSRGNVYAVWRGVLEDTIYSSRKITDPWPYYRVYLPFLQRMD